MCKAYSQQFTIPIFPDTQKEVDAKFDMFYSQIQWIVANKDSLDIPIVLHVGDIVENNTFDNWETASHGFEILDRYHINYALADGNHDNDTHIKDKTILHNKQSDHINLRKTEKFNIYFPFYRFNAQRGRYEENKSDNAYYTFKAGGLDWLVLTLEYCARQGPVDWANNIIANHPNFNVIILTHYFLNTDGTIGKTNGSIGDLSEQSIYDQLVKKHANILMVLSGHLTGSAWRVDRGEKGNKIYEILQDYQGDDYGGGYLRLLKINTAENTISARMYSPYYKQSKVDSSQFNFKNVSFIQP